MISVKHRGNFDKTDSFLKRMSKGSYMDRILDEYGKRGVEALKAATPRDSGHLADSWYYDVKRGKSGVTITWSNSYVNDGVPIAIILQYGHGTGTGGYVQGRDYINPAMRPVFDEILNEVWREVTK